MQECIRCGAVKADSEFSRDRSRESGLNRYCKACIREVWRKPKPEGWARKTSDMAAYMREYKRKFRLEHPDVEREKNRRKYESKMRREHGEGWRPRVKLTDDELKARKRERQKVVNEQKKAKRLIDPDSKQKHKARRAIQNRVLSGTITPEPCNVCGEKAEAHHPAYDRPLMVVWLCPSCHRAAHALTKTK